MLIAIVLYVVVGLYIDYYFNKENSKDYNVGMTLFHLILWPLILDCFFSMIKLDRKLKKIEEDDI